MNIVAVTACATGIAQTYMAAEVLEHCAKTRGYNIKVETQGALGIVNTLSPEDVRQANMAILTNDIGIENVSRFDGIKTTMVSIDDILNNPQKIMDDLQTD